MPKIVFIGQQPNSYEDEGTPLPMRPGSTGKRIVQMMGITEESFLNSFNVLNVSPFHDCDGFSPEYWFRNAQNILPLLEGRRVVLLGSRVAEAFGFNRTDYDYASWFDHPRENILFSVIPHPSGRNHLYNNPEMHEMVRSFLDMCWTLRGA